MAIFFLAKRTRYQRDVSLTFYSLLYPFYRCHLLSHIVTKPIYHTVLLYKVYGLPVHISIFFNSAIFYVPSKQNIFCHGVVDPWLPARDNCLISARASCRESSGAGTIQSDLVTPSTGQVNQHKTYGTCNIKINLAGNWFVWYWKV